LALQIAAVLLVACESKPPALTPVTRDVAAPLLAPDEAELSTADGPRDTAPLTEAQRIVAGAIKQVGVTTTYDSAYVKLDYPMGDVSIATGVCTDVVIRAMRHAGVDLQQLVHEDMRDSFAAYPDDWGLHAPDRNIDHRRVPNLMRYFERAGRTTYLSPQGDDYRPGDIVAWRLSAGRLHMGVVTDQRAPGRDVPLVVHNVGRGAQLADVLFGYELIGHYRWSDQP
jgi:hypothetical protein